MARVELSIEDASENFGGRSVPAVVFTDANSHNDTADNFPVDGLVENCCRNPGAEKSTTWCYTSEGDVAWDHCQL